MKKASAIIAIQAAVLIGIWSQVSFAETTPVTETAPAVETAAEADKPANYVILKAGMYSPSDKFDLDNYNGGHTTRFDSKTGFNGEIASGPLSPSRVGG